MTNDEIDQLKSWVIKESITLCNALKQNSNSNTEIAYHKEIGGTMFRIKPEIFIEWFQSNQDMIDIMKDDFIERCMCYDRFWYNMVAVADIV